LLAEKVIFITIIMTEDGMAEKTRIKFLPMRIR